MKPAIPSTTIQTGFHILLLQAIVVTFAINAEATSNFTSPLQTAAPPAISLHSAGTLCDRLLAVTEQGGSNLDPASSLSGGARIFMTLIDLGLSNIGPEFPELLKRIGHVADSEGPLNPFLGLKAPLGLALASRAEDLLPQLGREWARIQALLIAREARARGNMVDKQRDEHATAVVDGFVDVPFGKIKENSLDFTKIDYIGQTAEFYVFSKSFHAQNIVEVYLVSKVTQEVEFATKIFVEVIWNGMRSPWLHEGMIYGFASIPKDGKIGRDPSKKVPFISSELGVFRLDPSTKAVTRVKVPKVEGTTDFLLYRPSATDTVIGVQLRDSDRTEGQIWRFDYEKFAFIPTGLEFDIKTLGLKIEPWKDGIIHGRLSSTADGFALKIGPYYITDGTVIVQPGSSMKWQEWSIGDFMSEHPAGWGTRNAYSLSENFPEYRDLANWKASKPGSARAPIVFDLPVLGFPTEDKIFVQAVDGGRSILYMRIQGKSILGKAIVIDRATWSARPVRVVGGPSEEADGLRTVFRNRKGEILMQFASDLTVSEVAIWKFDFAKAQFDVQFHETYDFEAGNSAVDWFVDIESKSLIGWQKKEGLLLRLQIGLSREK